MAGSWMIFTNHDIDIDDYPILKDYLGKYRDKLEARAGRQLWWQLQAASAYQHLFKQPKIVWQDLAWHSKFCLDTDGLLTNDLCFILASSDKWLLAVLNSPIIWSWLWRNTIHGKDEVLRLKNIYTETLPIAPPTEETRTEVEEIVSRLIEITKINRSAYRDVLEWLQITYKIEKLGQKLENFANLELNEVVEEVRKRMRKTKSSDPLSPATLKALKKAYNDYAPAIQIRRTEALKLEHRLSDLVNQAYKLTPEEIDLMWKTAPPRMPISQQSN